LDLHVPLPDSGPHTIQVRTIDDTTGVTSATFQGETSRPDSVLQPGISGFVWRDTNGNASFDSGDGRLSGWTIRLSDAVGQPLSASDRLEPDDFPDGTLLNNPTGHPQVTLTGLGDSDGAVRAGTDARASTGSQVFQVHMQSGAWTSSWSDTTQLRADFSSPVSGVQLDAIGTHADAVARLEAYDAAGRLLARYTTRALGLGGVETMVISRLTSDVAYVVASGHGGSAADADTSVHLDNLRCGAETAATTDAQGSYRFVGLSPGTYTAEAVPPNGVLPLTNTQVVTLAASATGQPVEPAAHVDFAVPTSPPTADLVDPKAAGTPFDWQLNVRRYLEVTFNDVNKAGLDISTILSSQPKFTLKGAGAGNVAVRWTPTLVSGTTYRFPFTGTFTNGPVNVNFVAGSFADALGNLNEASTQSFIVRFQPSLWLDTPQPVREGSKRQKTLNVPVRLSGPIAGTITVKYATANGTAIAGKDYKATRGTLTFGPKMPRAQFIKVPILDDRKHENTETFQIKLFSPKGKVAVPVAVGAATGRILDNDPKPRLSVASAPVREGNSGTTKATFPTALPAAGILTATVSRATGKGTATLSGLLDTQSASTLARSGRDALFGGPESDWLLNLPPDARGQRSPNEG
jgi:hypothetical protein